MERQTVSTSSEFYSVLALLILVSIFVSFICMGHFKISRCVLEPLLHIGLSVTVGTADAFKANFILNVIYILTQTKAKAKGKPLHAFPTNKQKEPLSFVIPPNLICCFSFIRPFYRGHAVA
jgi:hypothetical protein